VHGMVRSFRGDTLAARDPLFVLPAVGRGRGKPNSRFIVGQVGHNDTIYTTTSVSDMNYTSDYY